MFLEILSRSRDFEFRSALLSALAHQAHRYVSQDEHTRRLISPLQTFIDYRFSVTQDISNRLQTWPTRQILRTNQIFNYANSTKISRKSRKTSMIESQFLKVLEKEARIRIISNVIFNVDESNERNTIRRKKRKTKEESKKNRTTKIEARWKRGNYSWS